MTAKGKTTALSTEVTPVLSKDVSFTEKVNAVDEALKNRAEAQKNIKLRWADVVKVLIELKMKVPGRRLEAISAQSLVGEVNILEPENDLLKDKETVAIANEIGWKLNDIVRARKFMEATEKKFKGFTEYTSYIMKVNDAKGEIRRTDEKATKVAQEKLQKVVDKYLEALEAYDETVESVANVKEYVSVVKDIAEISAIAQGTQVR